MRSGSLTHASTSMNVVSLPKSWVMLLMVGCFTLAIVCSDGGGAAPAQEMFPGPMYDEPRLQLPERILVFDSRLPPLWLEALQDGDDELQIRAARAIISAHQQGLATFDEAVPVLISLLSEDEQHPLVVLACAEALAELDRPIAAEAFASRLDGPSLPLATVIERSLGSWDAEKVETKWLARLSEQQPALGPLLLAIEGLGDIGSKAAVEELKSLVRSGASSRIRLAAARALAEIAPEDQVALAAELLDRPTSTIIDRLSAAQALRRGSVTGESLPILLQLGQDSNPAIAILALRHVWESAPEELLPLGPSLADVDDPKVKELAVEVLKRSASTDSILALHRLTNDPHPQVRRSARERISELWTAGTQQTLIRSETARQLEQPYRADDWRTFEQHLRLAAEHDFEENAPAALRLLRANRFEVGVSAAYCLRLLDVDSTLPAALEYADSIAELVPEPPIRLLTEQQISQLFQWFGIRRFHDANGLMRKFITKSTETGFYSRGAAIWALGLIYEREWDDQTEMYQPVVGAMPYDSQLAEQLVTRLNDRDAMIPELPVVRQMSAFALGKMMSDEQLEALRRSRQLDDVSTPIGYTAAWSVNRLANEPMPTFQPETGSYGPWFLEPLD